MKEIVNFDWDVAYHKAFADVLGLDFFEGPRDVPLKYLKNEFNPQDEVKPIGVSKNTFKIEYEQAKTALEAVKNYEQNIQNMVDQYDIVHKRTSAAERDSLVRAATLRSSKSKRSSRKQWFIDGMDAVQSETNSIVEDMRKHNRIQDVLKKTKREAFLHFSSREEMGLYFMIIEGLKQSIGATSEKVFAHEKLF